MEKPVMDRTKLGLVFAKEKPASGCRLYRPATALSRFLPGPNYRVDASFEMRKEVTLASLHPHMHARGKDFEYRLVFPNGETRTLLRVPRTTGTGSFGTTSKNRLSCPKARASNAPRISTIQPHNPENPDPTKTVIWGQQSWDEMMVGFFNLVYDAGMSPKDLQPEKKK